MTVRCLYSCRGCGLTDIAVDVPARGADEEVAVWMQQAIRTLARDHGRRSPWCRPKALQEVKIPLTGADRIGGPSIQ
jgi:hypothetical protein